MSGNEPNPFDDQEQDGLSSSPEAGSDPLYGTPGDGFGSDFGRPPDDVHGTGEKVTHLDPGPGSFAEADESDEPLVVHVDEDFEGDYFEGDHEDKERSSVIEPDDVPRPFAGEGHEQTDRTPVNRPAEGAPQASPGDVLAQDFSGAEGASDFLGLDLEFDFGPPSMGGELELQTGPFAETQDSVALETTAEVADGRVTDAPADVEGGFDEEDPDDDFLGSEPVDGELDDLEDGLFGLSPADQRKKILLLAAGGFCVGLALVLLVLLVPRFSGDGPERTDSTPTSVATGPKTTPTPTAAGVEPGVGDPSRPGLGNVHPYDPRLTLPGLLALAEIAPDLPSALPAGDPIAAGGPVVGTPTPVRSTDPVDSSTGAAVPGGDSGPLTVDPSASTAPIDYRNLLAPRPDGESFLLDNLGELDVVWRGVEIPASALSSPAKVLTPGVGQVRAHLFSGEIFEGRLHALGEGKVWLDLELGRIGIRADRVERLERLPDLAVDRSIDPDQLATGRRVRARVPGGVIYGRVRTVKGTQVTLVTDSGARVTLDNPVLEPISQTKSVVLKN